ncbi:MAG: hypothetical protein EXQ99_01085 [Alphaproteobacteria bacterium]|nr:hypothetical protein [Alphaproteobacteria bacterium]
MIRVDLKRLDLAAEFMAKPIGTHSAELQQILWLFRGAAAAGKHVLVCLEPHRKWMLAQMDGRPGKPLKLHPKQVFRSLEEAERTVFRLRWKHYTGRALPKTLS